MDENEDESLPLSEEQEALQRQAEEREEELERQRSLAFFLEQKQLREQRDMRQNMQPQGAVDADLAHLGAPTPAPPGPVRSQRRRLPHDVPLLYMGRRWGGRHDETITLIVPDEDNYERVAALAEILDPGLDETGQRRQQPDLTGLHVSGPSYDFIRGETTLVDAEDVPFFLTHPKLDFRRMDRAPDEMPFLQKARSD